MSSTQIAAPRGPQMTLDLGFDFAIERIRVKTPAGAAYDLTGKTVMLRVGTAAVARLFEVELSVLGLATAGVVYGEIPKASVALLQAGDYRYTVHVVEDDRLVLWGDVEVRDHPRAA